MHLEYTRCPDHFFNHSNHSAFSFIKAHSGCKVENEWMTWGLVFEVWVEIRTFPRSQSLHIQSFARKVAYAAFSCVSIFVFKHEAPGDLKAVAEWPPLNFSFLRGCRETLSLCSSYERRTWTSGWSQEATDVGPHDEMKCLLSALG